MFNIPDYQRKENSDLVKEINAMAKEDQRKLLSAKIAREIEGINGEVDALINLVKKKEARGITWLRRWYRVNQKVVLSIMISFILTGCGPIAFAETASYYTYESCRKEGTSGVYTASGEVYNENDLTCAMPHHNFGGVYKVTNLASHKSVIVRHNDYGPNKKLVKQGRIIDLSKAAFQSIANLKDGVITVQIERIK